MRMPSLSGGRSSIAATSSNVSATPIWSRCKVRSVAAALDGIGEADYSDEGMLQYLRTERVVPAYQTRGYKLVELLRIYEVGTPSRA